MYCTRCGAQLEDGVKFCTHCGARVEPLVPAAPASGDGGQVPAAGPDAGSAPEVSVEETLVTQPVPESPAPPSHQRLSRQRPQSQLPPPHPPASQGSERTYVPEYENEGPGVERKHPRRGRGNIVGITVLVVALIAVAAVAGVLFGGPMVKTASYYRGSLSMDTSIKANDKWAVGVVGFGVSGDGTTMVPELGGLRISGTIDSTFEADGDVVYRLSVVSGSNSFFGMSLESPEASFLVPKGGRQGQALRTLGLRAQGNRPQQDRQLPARTVGGAHVRRGRYGQAGFGEGLWRLGQERGHGLLRAGRRALGQLRPHWRGGQGGRCGQERRGVRRRLHLGVHRPGLQGDLATKNAYLGNANAYLRTVGR